MLNFVFPAEVFYRKKQKTNHFLDDLPVFWVQKYYFTGYLPGNYSQNNTFTNSRLGGALIFLVNFQFCF